LLVKPKNKHELQSGIILLLKKEKLAKRFATKLKKKIIENYSFERVYSKLKKVIVGLIEENNTCTT